jgi:hypothetical protein
MEEMSFQIPQPRFDDQNLPAPIIETMFAGDFINPSESVEEDNNMLAYLRSAANSNVEQEIDQEQRDKEADDPLITADLQLQPVGQTPQVPQEATQPTDQVTAQQVQQLFPFDTTAAAIAQRRTNRG